MQIWEIIILGIGLSMDAFAVAICKGLSSEKFSVKAALIVGIWFGAFQALMPLIGYLLGSFVSSYIEAFDHWIAFILLAFIGGKMIYEAIKGEEKQDASVTFAIMLPLAIGTSIDAMAAGITLAFSAVNIFIAIAIIGVITFALSALGVKIGNIFGSKFKKKAEIFGGAILILLGLKILIEHLLF
ncbi:MAG: manganese efflux pump [Clostridiales bacterium]|nr:manganese efflux pump [Clostridiales bacterium]